MEDRIGYITKNVGLAKLEKPKFPLHEARALAIRLHAKGLIKTRIPPMPGEPDEKNHYPSEQYDFVPLAEWYARIQKRTGFTKSKIEREIEGGRITRPVLVREGNNNGPIFCGRLSSLQSPTQTN